MKSVLNNRLQISDNDKITFINVSCRHVLCSTYRQQLPSFLLQDIRNTTLATYQNKSLDPMIQDLTIYILIGCQATMLRDNLLFLYEFLLLLGVKQLCCETTYCFCMSSYWVSSNYVARQPIVIVRILIGCQATMLRDNLLLLYEFLLLLLLLCCHWSQWQPIEPLGEKL
jgi:hypothetical protein